MKVIIEMLRKYNKQLVSIALASSILAINTTSVSADTWKAKKPEEIKINKNINSYEIENGDTLWAIGQTINLKPEFIAEINGINISKGEEKYLQIGRKIKWSIDENGNEVIKVENKTEVITKEDKIEPTKPVGTDLVSNQSQSEQTTENNKSSEPQIKQSNDNIIQKTNTTSINKENTQKDEKINKNINETENENSEPKEELQEVSKDKTTIDSLSEGIEEIKEIQKGESTTSEPLPEFSDIIKGVKSEVTDSTIVENKIYDNGKDVVRILNMGTTVNNGYGNMAIIESNGKFAIYDFGLINNGDDPNILFNYFDSLGIKEFEFATISHYDWDHISFFLRNDFHKKYKINKLITKPGQDIPDNYWLKGANIKSHYKNVQDMVDKYNIPVEWNYDLQKFNFGDFELKFYDTGYQDLSKMKDGTYFANLSMINLAITKDNYTVLLTGDLHLEDEMQIAEEVLKDYSNVDVLQVGHHGYRDAASKEFLEKIKTPIGVVPNKYSNIETSVDKKLNSHFNENLYYTGNGHVSIDMTDTKNGINLTQEESSNETLNYTEKR